MLNESQKNDLKLEARKDYKIDLSKPLSQCIEEFESIQSAFPETSSRISVAFEKIGEKQGANCWWQIAYYALPILDVWAKNNAAAHPESTEYQTRAIDMRQILFAYLKIAITAQVNETAKTQSVAPNLRTQTIEFLISLSGEMFNHKTHIVNGTEPWAIRFFGDPWNGQNPEMLNALEMIRNHASCVLTQNKNGSWQFIHPLITKTLDSVNIVEVTRISSSLIASGVPMNQAINSALKEIARNLMDADQGTMVYIKYEPLFAPHLADIQIKFNHALHVLNIAPKVTIYEKHDQQLYMKSNTEIDARTAKYNFYQLMSDFSFQGEYIDSDHPELLINYSKEKILKCTDLVLQKGKAVSLSSSILNISNQTEKTHRNTHGGSDSKFLLKNKK